MVFCMPPARKGIELISDFLVVKNQIANLIPDPSFGHNLCFRCPNGSCDPILDIMFQELSNDIRNSSSH
jgi:hypothetical protein